MEEEKYIMTDQDKEQLKEYMSLEEFHSTTAQIESSVHLRPFDYKTPFWKNLLLKVVTIVLLIIYTYGCFIVIQLALFNFIMIGVIFVYFQKIYNFFQAICNRYDYNYRNSPFKKFIESENERLYTRKNIELIGGEQGKWLELQLPDNIEDKQLKEDIQERLHKYDQNQIIFENENEDPSMKEAEDFFERKKFN
mmetsp:Transcript_12054/g.11927  ORF Transcript_12054/g.11927 Transcript_12054/m.11927 type:complete len:194 (+) Transcript_12054:306-887(+)